MTPQQEHIALQNFKTSMIQSGHGDELDFDHSGSYFANPWTQKRWLGYKRRWEEQVLKEHPTLAGLSVTDDYTPPNPNTEEFVFVGGPLHGLRHIDPNVPWLVTEENGVQYLYVQKRITTELIAPILFVLYAMHTLR